MRIVHVVQPWTPTTASPWRDDHRDRPCDAGPLACAAAIRATPEHEHAVLLVGGSLAHRRARDLGLEARARLAPPLASPALGARSLRRAIRAHSPDLVQVWGRWLEPPGQGESPVLVADLRAGTLGPVGRPEALRLPLPAPRPRERTRPTRERRIVLLDDPPERAEATSYAMVLAALEVSGVALTFAFARHAREPDRATLRARLWSTHAPREVHGPVVDLLDGAAAAIMAPGTRFSTVTPAPTYAQRVLAGEALARGVPVVTASPTLIPPTLHDSCLAESAHPAHLAHALGMLLEDPARLADVAGLASSGAPDGREFASVIRAAWSGRADAGFIEPRPATPRSAPLGAPA